MAWLSPAYPIGAFSYSGGIEWAVEAGDIRDAETLREWLAVMLAEGGGFCDAVFFVHAHRATAAPTTQLCKPSPSLLPRSFLRRSDFWKRRHRAAPLSRRRVRHGLARR